MLEQYQTGQTLPPIDPRDLVNLSQSNPEALAEQGLAVTDLTDAPLELAIADIKPIEVEDDVALLAVLDVGGVPVRISALMTPDHQLDKRMIYLSRAEKLSNTQEVTDNVVFPLQPGDAEEVFGRTGIAAKRLGFLDESKVVSRQHFSAEYTAAGTLKLTDLNSTNGTKLITAETITTQEVLPEVKDIGEVAVGHTVEVELTETSDLHKDQLTELMHALNTVDAMRRNRGLAQPNEDPAQADADVTSYLIKNMQNAQAINGMDSENQKAPLFVVAAAAELLGSMRGGWHESIPLGAMEATGLVADDSIAMLSRISYYIRQEWNFNGAATDEKAGRICAMLEQELTLFSRKAEQGEDIDIMQMTISAMAMAAAAGSQYAGAMHKLFDQSIDKLKSK